MLPGVKRAISPVTGILSDNQCLPERKASEFSMIVFEIKINGKIATAAGIGEYGILLTDIEWEKRDPQFRPKGAPKKAWGEDELFLRTWGGTRLTESTFEHHRWAKLPLSVGDKVVIRILERPECDEPTERERSERTKPSRAASRRKVTGKRAKRR